MFIRGVQADGKTTRGIMKKWASVSCAVAALGAIWTGTAWYTGKQLEAGLGPLAETVGAQARQIGLTMDQSVSLEQVSFERGVFTSHARYRVLSTSLDKDSTAQAQDIQFVARIDHGPFPLFRLSAGHFLPAMAAARVQLAQTPPTQAWFSGAKGAAPVVAEAVASYGRVVSGTLTLAPVEYAQDGTTVSFSGLQARASVAPDGRHTTFAIATEKLDSTEPVDQAGVTRTRRLSLRGLDFSHESAETADGVIAGASQAKIKHWAVEIDDQPVTLRDLVMSADASGPRSAMNGSFKAQIAGIDVRGTQVASVRMGARAVNVDMESFRAFRDTLEQAEGRASMGEKMAGMAHLMKVLLAKPGFSIDPLQIDTPSGPATLRLEVALDAPTLWNRVPAAIMKETVKKLDFRLSVPSESLVDLISVRGLAQGQPVDVARDAARQQADAIRDRFLTSRWGHEEGGKLTSHLYYEGGQVEINGERMTVEAFMARPQVSRYR